MSDHTFREWPPVDPSRKPREKGSWSVEDRQMLLITLVGGLAANVGTVLSRTTNQPVRSIKGQRPRAATSAR